MTGSRLRLTAVCVALLLAAVLLDGGGRLAWFTVDVEAVGRGAVPVTATGADLLPVLSAVALLALGAIAAAVALSGVARRGVGVVVAAAGAATGAAVARLLLAPPGPAQLAALPGAPAGGVAGSGPVVSGPGSPVAALGVVLLVTAGLVLVAGERRLHRLGSRFGRRSAAAPAGDSDTDPDRAAWDALSTGHDPTVDPPVELPGTGRRGRTDEGHRGGAV